MNFSAKSFTIPKMFDRVINNTSPYTPRRGIILKFSLTTHPLSGLDGNGVQLHLDAPAHILKITNVVCCTPNTLNGAHLFLFHLFPTLSVTLLTIALIKCCLQIIHFLKLLLVFHVSTTQGRIQALFEIGNCFWAHENRRPNI